MEEGLQSVVDLDKLADASQASELPIPTLHDDWYEHFLSPQTGQDVGRRQASKMARKAAMPTEYRGQLWLRLSGGKSLLDANPRLYEDSHRGVLLT